MGELAYYAPTYQEARTQFRQRATEKGATLVALSVNEQEGLYTDIALWQGSSDTLVLHVSGVHGVEAYPGSAVQCAFLDQWTPDQLGQHSLALIHCVNPFGMRHHRRWNTNNVDLNRNFLEQYDLLPANPTYHKLTSFLNPQQKHQLNGFTWQAIQKLFRYRFSALQQAIAQGQYDYPKGLFFGGIQPASETQLLLDFFQRHLGSYSCIRGIDFHTGLGKYQKSSFYLDSDYTPCQHQQAEALLRSPVIHALPRKRKSYQPQGSLVAGLKRHYASQDFLMITQEIGTLGAISILRELRKENYYYHFTPMYQPTAGQRLKQIFCPSDLTWKTTAVRAGVQGLRRLIDWKA